MALPQAPGLQRTKSHCSTQPPALCLRPHIQRPQSFPCQGQRHMQAHDGCRSARVTIRQEREAHRRWCVPCPPLVGPLRHCLFPAHACLIQALTMTQPSYKLTHCGTHTPNNRVACKTSITCMLARCSTQDVSMAARFRACYSADSIYQAPSTLFRSRVVHAIGEK